MAQRNILQEGDPTLTKKSRLVTVFDDRLHTLIDDMRETLVKAEGLGLAAPQVGVLRRVVVVADINRDSGKTRIIELVNPEIIESEGEQVGAEGCLSIPGFMGIVKRPIRAKLRARNRHGKSFEIEGTGLTARAFFHEIDHLNGVLFPSVAEKVLGMDEYLESLDKR